MSRIVRSVIKYIVKPWIAIVAWVALSVVIAKAQDIANLKDAKPLV